MRNPFRRLQQSPALYSPGGGSVPYEPPPDPTKRKGSDIPRDVCRVCQLPIEYFNGAWWWSGTCRTNCGDGPSHTPAVFTQDGELLDVPAPIHDPKKLAKWLDS